MKFTGHSDYKSMKPYIDITEAAKRDAISLMEKAFDAKGWKDNGWPSPELKEHFGPNDDRVELTLRLGAGVVEKRVDDKESDKVNDNVNDKVDSP